MQKDEETMNIQQPEVQPQIQQATEQQIQPQPQIQPQVEQPQQPSVNEEVDDYYKRLFEEDNTQGTKVPDQIYKPEDLDFFKEMLNPDEFEYLLGKAAELNNPKQVEELVENNPEQAEGVIDDNTPLDVEAKQAEDGGSDEEVSNEAVENFIEEHNNPNTPDPLVGDNKKGILGDADFDSFINSIEQQESKDNPGKVLTNEIKTQLANHPMRSVLENKIRNMFTDFRRGKDAKFNNALGRVNEGWDSALENAIKYNPDLVNKFRDLMKDPDRLVLQSVGLDLSNPQMRDYCENKFGHDFVKTQDRQRLNRDLRNRNLALTKYISKHMDHASITNPETGKAYSNYELTGKIARGELDPTDIFKDKPTINSSGKQVNHRVLAQRSKAREFIQELKLNNEIRSYLSGAFDDYIDVSQLKGLTGLELRDALKAQIGDKVDQEVQKDIEQEVDWLESKEESKDPIEQISKGIDWSKVKEYKPGEDPIEWLRKDDYDPRVEENLNYDYERGVGAPGVLKNKDEDFAGPDELPAQIYDNSDFQPKQLPAVINDGLPAEQYYEPVYDTSDYNFDWSWEDITPEQIDQEVDEDEDIPEEEKEEAKERRKRIAKFMKGRNLTASGSGHGAGSAFKTTYDKTNGSMSFGSGKGIMGSASIGNFMANPKWDKPKQEPVKEVRSEASKAPEPVETVSKSSPIGVKSNPTTSNRTSNGGFNSGGVNKTGNSLIKVNKVSLPNGEANNQPDAIEGISQTNNLRDSRIQLLEERIKQLDPELQEHFGFSTKYKHVEYKDTPIDECSGGQLQEIEEILDACGV